MGGWNKLFHNRYRERNELRICLEETFFYQMKKRKKLRNLCHLRNLLMVALADGNLSRSEREFLEIKAVKYQISPDRLSRMLSDPDKVKTIFPKDLGERLQMLYDLAEMTLIDHVTTPEEIAICREIAAKMDVIPESIDQILKDLEKRVAFVDVR